MARFGTFFHVLFSIFLFLSGCSRSTNSSPSEEPSPRERVVVSGAIGEDTVWEWGKEYYITGDVTVETGATLTIQPEVWVLFKKETESDYYGITVEGTLIADGGDSTTAILFTSGAAEWGRKPGDWRGIEVEASSDSSSVIRYCRIEYANIGIRINESSPQISYDTIAYCADAGILFYQGSWGAVRYCTMRNNWDGIRLENVTSGVIERCTITENEKRGIMCKSSSPDILNNFIARNGDWGIYCLVYASPLIQWNEIVDHATGEIAQLGMCSSKIWENTIVHNTGSGIEVGQSEYAGCGEPNIEWNNFLSESDTYAVMLHVSYGCQWRGSILAQNNYWGTDNPAEIERKIYDQSDTVGRLGEMWNHSTVVYMPFATDRLLEAGIQPETLGE